jgi:hypothetical protein
MRLTSTPNRRSTVFNLATARVALIGLAALTMGLYLASVSLKLAELRQVYDCAALCGGSRLNPDQAARLLAAGLSLDFYASYVVVTRLANALVSWSVALLVLWRRSSDRMALLTALLLITFPTNGGGVLQPVPHAFPTLWFPVQAVQYIGWQSFLIFFLLFPSGRWVPRLRYVGWFLSVWAIAFIPGYFLPDNPMAAMPDWVASIMFPSMFGLCLFGQVYRYRRVSTAVERQQTKWVVYGLALFVGAGVSAAIALSLLAPWISLGTPLTPADFVADWILNVLLNLFLPVALAIAILRYRLFEIDVLIRRTLVYAVLTAVLALIYLGSILVLQSIVGVFAGQANTPLVTVLSTLLIAALFVPLRRRVQAVIDRRFFRRKYDAARTLTAYGVTLRDETNLEQLSAHLTAVVDETMQPESVGLWLSPARRAEAPIV